MKTTPLQCIVMPLRPSSDPEFRLTGLGLHFLLGNVMAVNTMLDEFWFGWRIKKLFPGVQEFQAYCNGGYPEFSIVRFSREQNIRFWISGEAFTTHAILTLYDALEDKTVSRSIPFSLEDNLVGFRSMFMDWLETNGISWEVRDKEASLWKERLDQTGLDAIGNALMTLYRQTLFANSSLLDRNPFDDAVKKAPSAFMSHDLLGWALYRNKTYPEAVEAFLSALAINPQGAGAMAGLMWCGIMSRDETSALYWARCKAEAGGKDVGQSLEKARRIFCNYSD